MGFDLASAKPIAAPPKGGFDLSSAKPVSAARPAPALLPEADPVQITETDPNTGQKTTRMQYPSGTRPRQTAAQKQADIDNEASMRATPVNNDSIAQRALGFAEPIYTLGSSMVGNVIGNLYGIGKSVVDGQYGTPEGARNAKATAEKLANYLTIKPGTDTGKANVQRLADMAAPLEGLQGVASADALRMGANAAAAAGGLRSMAGVSAAAQGAQDAAAVAGAGKLTAGKLADLVRAPKPAMAGVGAAATAEETLRAQRFANMRADMKPTKGILTRSIDDVQFEREAAKRVEGKGLDNRFADLNKGMEQHMDSMLEETGAQASGARSAGKNIVKALEMKRDAKKAEIKLAYDEAKKSGAMAEQVSTAPLVAFAEKNRSAAKNAPIISAVENEVERLTGGSGKISINDAEELRKMVRKLAEPGTPNGTFGDEALQVIDNITDGKGGPQYQQARRMYENYSKEFKDRAVVSNLLRNKKGTKDRAVAFSDVADSILMDTDVDAMRHAFRVLEAHPKGTAPEIVAAGQQAAAELRGHAINKIKDRMFSNGGADSAGKVVGSEAKIKAIVRELDNEGKLEPLFGKQGAQEIRDTAQVATDIYTTPKGTINNSNTASAMERVMNKFAGIGGGTPVVGHALKYVAKKVESSAYKKRVDAALEPRPLSDMTGGR